VLAASSRLRQAGGTEQSQIVRHQRLAEGQSLRGLPHTRRPVAAAGHDPQPIGLAQQPKEFREFRYIVGVNQPLFL
jgi:hypothetical protein